MRALTVSVIAVLLEFALPLFAWDVEHDAVAQLTGEAPPTEIKAQFDFDDYLDEIKALSGAFPIQRRIPNLSNKKER